MSRLATASTADGRVVFGPITDDQLSDISGGAWPTLGDAIAIDQRQAVASAAAKASRHALSSLTLLPPIPNPQRLLCIGVNYADHAAEMAAARPPSEGYPMVFTRYPSSVVAHGQPLVRPKVSTAFDYEGELAIIIGARGRYVPAASAFDVIAGYSCFMDGSIRDYQRHTAQYTPGKNFEHSGAFGPWIVTSDEFDPADGTLTTYVNDQQVQHAPFAHMIHDIPRLIEYCSTFTTLEPGDVIATGTPGGVGAARTPPLWLKPGDTVRVEIPGVGNLTNPVVAE